MFGLPLSTECKKQLPKKAIYAKFNLKPSQRESFDADIARIDIVAIVSPTTIHTIAEGTEVKGVYVLALQMKRKDYDSKNLVLLTKLIPQKMVFALQFENQTQFAVFHTRLLISSWQPTEDAMLPISGLNLDIVWENIVKGIGEIKVEHGNTLTEQIKAEEQRNKLLAQIAILEKKMVKERQPRKKREYFEQIKKLKSQLDNEKQDI